MKIMLIYAIAGAVVCTVASTLAGLFYSYWLSIVISIIYFIGLFFVIKYNQVKQKDLEMKLVLNMAFVLSKFNKKQMFRLALKLRMGYLGQWVEIGPCENIARVA